MSDLADMVAPISSEYPTLASHLKNFALQWGDPARNPGGGSIEFYPPWESENPNPGRPTIEVFDRNLQGPALQKAIYGDSLHHLGGTDEHGTPVDPHFHSMKQDLIKSLTPEQLAVDQRAYDRAKGHGDGRSFDDWMQDSRGDAYVRGLLAPDANDEWKDVYTPDQRKTLADMFFYLKGQPL